MNNIKNAFKNKALIGFVMAGDPDLDTTKEIIISMVNFLGWGLRGDSCCPLIILTNWV